MFNFLKRKRDKIEQMPRDILAKIEPKLFIVAGFSQIFKPALLKLQKLGIEKHYRKSYSPIKLFI